MYSTRHKSFLLVITICAPHPQMNKAQKATKIVRKMATKNCTINADIVFTFIYKIKKSRVQHWLQVFSFNIKTVKILSSRTYFPASYSSALASVVWIEEQFRIELNWIICSRTKKIAYSNLITMNWYFSFCKEHYELLTEATHLQIGHQFFCWSHCWMQVVW
jgi:hypothetical protein